MRIWCIKVGNVLVLDFDMIVVSNTSYNKESTVHGLKILLQKLEEFWANDMESILSVCVIFICLHLRMRAYYAIPLSSVCPSDPFTLSSQLLLNPF
jgi:hypothetical protein